LDDVGDSEDGDLASAFGKAALDPPITHQSLRELDIARIINNPKLRHDVNFDKELHFRPNLDGSRGRQKMKCAEEYWRALVAELKLYRVIGADLMSCTSLADQSHLYGVMTACQIRIPIIFETIRDILKTLVPERDQDVVTEKFDRAMVMQEISKGVFDMIGLAKWIASLLKSHCAPMRDEWIDQMVLQVEKGVEENCERRIVVGLRQLLGILEAMKLDVANHQIRHLRPMLIEDGVNFQIKYHFTRLHFGRFDRSRAIQWFTQEKQRLGDRSVGVDDVSVFVSALLRSLLSQTSLSTFPETFSLDSDRLRAIRADFYTFVSVQTCVKIMESVFAAHVKNDARNKATSALEVSLASIVSDARKYWHNRGNIAVEIVRLVLAAEGSLETMDAVRIDSTERSLKIELYPASMEFTARCKAFYRTHLTELDKMVHQNLSLTPLQLHDKLFTPTSSQVMSKGSLVFSSSSLSPRLTAGPVLTKTREEVLKRLCHVAVLHWKIWSRLAYEIPVVFAQQSTATVDVSLEKDATHVSPAGIDVT